jgi:CRP-like cAMP-binding protein
MKEIKDLLQEHPFFRDLPPEDIDLIAGCGRNKVFKVDGVMSVEGSTAEEFFVIRRGRVALEMHSPGRGRIVVETAEDGDVVGWSWLFPPYKWAFDVRAVVETHVVSLDGHCLRRKAEADPALGFRLMKKFARVLVERLNATRLQLLDVYGQSNDRA